MSRPGSTNSSAANPPFAPIIRSKLARRLFNKPLLIKIGIGVGVFLLCAGATALYPGKPQKQSLSPELKSISDSINHAQAIADPFVRERFIQTEAKRLGVTSDDYRKLFAIRKRNSDVLPDVEEGSPWNYVTWFYQDLSSAERRGLMWVGLLWVFDVVPKLAFLFVGWKFLMEIPQRERTAKYQAWQVIHSAYGQKSSGARIEALQDLLEQGEFLEGLSLEAGADLSQIQLPQAKLIFAHLEQAILIGAHLEQADLSSAHLEGADLRGAHLEGANLIGAHLERAILFGAYLERADLFGAHLQGAHLQGARLQGAHLEGANLEGANLSSASLSNITWNEETNWKGVRGLETAINVPGALKQQLGQSNGA